MDYNYSGETADTRDAFLESEIDYLKQLVQIPEFLQVYEQYKNFGVSQLSERLKVLTEMMERGEVREEDEGKVELEVMCCCLAIEDAVRRKTRVKTPDYDDYEEEKMTNGRSR